jgi:hypothetical protein
LTAELAGSFGLKESADTIYMTTARLSPQNMRKNKYLKRAEESLKKTWLTINVSERLTKPVFVQISGDRHLF